MGPVVEQEELNTCDVSRKNQLCNTRDKIRDKTVATIESDVHQHVPPTPQLFP